MPEFPSADSIHKAHAGGSAGEKWALAVQAREVLDAAVREQVARNLAQMEAVLGAALEVPLPQGARELLGGLREVSVGARLRLRAGEPPALALGVPRVNWQTALPAAAVQAALREAGRTLARAEHPLARAAAPLALEAAQMAGRYRGDWVRDVAMPLVRRAAFRGLLDWPGGRLGLEVRRFGGSFALSWRLYGLHLAVRAGWGARRTGW